MKSLLPLYNHDKILRPLHLQRGLEIFLANAVIIAQSLQTLANLNNSHPKILYRF